jgi:lysophospholipase L1-like esterase
LTLYLPYNSVVEVEAIGPAHAMAPAPAAAGGRKPWIAFGDSITHGNNATDPGLTYPAIAARLLGIDHWNLGFAGAARGEPPVAEALAAMPASVISLAFGTNLMRFGMYYDRAAWREVFRNFIEIIRNGHPDTPLLVITPIHRSAANAERTPNARGLDQRAIRQEEEEVAAAASKAGDRQLHVLSGLDVLGESSAPLLGDGIHPGDVGRS